MISDKRLSKMFAREVAKEPDLALLHIPDAAILAAMRSAFDAGAFYSLAVVYLAALGGFFFLSIFGQI